MRDSIESLRSAISLLAGHGVMECFSALPRLLRDAMINEQWEGPRNLLLNQIHRDLRRVAQWYPPGEVAADLLPEEHAGLAPELERLLALDLFDGKPDTALVAAARDWDELVQALFHRFQDEALNAL